MPKAYILLIMGIWVAVLPYLGFPGSLKDIFFFLTGLGFIFFSFILYRQSKPEKAVEEKTFENFSENNPTP